MVKEATTNTQTAEKAPKTTKVVRKKAGLADIKAEVEAAQASEAPVKTTQETAPANEPRKPKKDALGRSQATGKKKNAIARVIIKMGKGKITVNGRTLEDYFPRPVLRMIINQPFAITNREGQFDVQCTMVGGGLSGQAYALRHGISRCLDLFEPELRPALKKAGFLTRDSRVVERKKPGLAKARKRFQFSKR